MANVLSAALLAAQESASRYPLVEIKAGQFSNDLPLPFLSEMEKVLAENAEEAEERDV